ncbi:MAG TPA: hypothetical protein VHG93_07875 [Longimicrobium sp.]|nr:hypothetical protein [Longimicrobium sp.]
MAVALLPMAAVLLYSVRVVPPEMARRVGFARITEVFVLKAVRAAVTLASTATFPAAAAMGGFLSGRWWIDTLVIDLPLRSHGWGLGDR